MAVALELRNFNGLSLKVEKGRILAVTGLSAGSRRRLARALMGHPAESGGGGRLFCAGRRMARAPAYERARRGLFVAFADPPVLPGISLSEMMRQSIRARGQPRQSVLQLRGRLRELLGKAGLDDARTRRGINVGASPTSARLLELVQLAFLEPRAAVLAGIEEGLSPRDIDRAAALIEETVSKGTAVLLLASRRNLLDRLGPETVSVSSLRKGSA